MCSVFKNGVLRGHGAQRWIAQEYSFFSAGSHAAAQPKIFPSQRWLTVRLVADRASTWQLRTTPDSIVIGTECVANLCEAVETVRDQKKKIFLYMFNYYLFFHTRTSGRVGTFKHTLLRATAVCSFSSRDPSSVLITFRRLTTEFCGISANFCINSKDNNHSPECAKVYRILKTRLDKKT